MPISASHWKRLSPLLDAALDLPPAQRAMWLSALPPEHDDLRDSLAELLSHGKAVETDDFLSRLPPFSAPPTGLSLEPGGIVGPYRLLRELGAGGTSSVWLAEREDGSIQRKVALKLPHLGLVDRGIAERIARERDILAGLEHPNIARLYDAGIDERGRPYLALEYVQGVAPDEYARIERMTMRRKLRLFLDVLKPVAFAHARLIVHRDLKPNNILIGENGAVCLLDFGIARLLQPDATRVAHTMVGNAALTPAYAAPEQFTGQPVTVATDVYSLGVILYELLTGMSPYSPDGRSLGAYEHQVLHVEPPLASRAARPSEAAALRGDIDTIVAKALEKKPADRYASVEAFANDVERFLAAEPISARRRSLGYVARKFITRNAVPVSLGALAIVVLGAALGVAAWKWRDAERQRVIAIDRLADAIAAEEFTSSVLIENIQPGQSLSFEQLIERSEQIARDTGANDLRTRIYATDFLSNWYGANGLYRDAEIRLTRTIESLPADQPLLGAVLRCRRARLWDELGTHEDAVATLDEQIRVADADDAIASRCLLDRSAVASSNADAHGALAFALEARRRYERAGVESVFDRANLLIATGGAYGVIGDFDRAHALYAETLRLFEVAGRGRSRAAANLRDDWATIWMNAGNPLRALDEIDRSWTMMHELAPAARNTDDRMTRRARILTQLGDYAGAVAEFDAAERLAGPRGNLANLASIRIGKADALTQSGRLGEAETALESAAAVIAQARLSATNLIVVRHHMTRAQWLAARGETRAAREAFGDALARYESQDCCAATRALIHADRAVLELDSDAGAAATDAARARELAPSSTSETFSRFTGRAWYVTALVFEKDHHPREASEAFATAAVQFAGSVGERHPDTLRARAGIERVSRASRMKKHD
ncbi:MAG TPA: serine/threonine-protein kinase [Steroidobacteraceae bacterium]|nr:serine/threonine-protein kinase [Steroidobacteraceae bacterium]